MGFSTLTLNVAVAAAERKICENQTVRKPSTRTKRMNKLKDFQMELSCGNSLWLYKLKIISDILSKD